MSSLLSPVVSEFETTEQKTEYESWLNLKVNYSHADVEPAISYDEVMIEIDRLIEQV